MGLIHTRMDLHFTDIKLMNDKTLTIIYYIKYIINYRMYIINYRNLILVFTGDVLWIILWTEIYILAQFQHLNMQPWIEFHVTLDTLRTIGKFETVYFVISLKVLNYYEIKYYKEWYCLLNTCTYSTMFPFKSFIFLSRSFFTCRVYFLSYIHCTYITYKLSTLLITHLLFTYSHIKILWTFP